MNDDRAAPEVLEFMQVLWALAHALEARSKRMHRELGVTGPQRLLLRVVGEWPDSTPGDAARRLRLDPGTVSRLSTGLVRRGLVRREADPGDRRKHRLRLTPAGRRLNGNHEGTVEAAVRAALDGAGAAEVERTRSFVGRLTAALAFTPPRAPSPRSPAPPPRGAGRRGRAAPR